MSHSNQARSVYFIICAENFTGTGTKKTIIKVWLAHDICSQVTWEAKS